MGLRSTLGFTAGAIDARANVGHSAWMVVVGGGEWGSY